MRPTIYLEHTTSRPIVRERGIDRRQAPTSRLSKYSFVGGRRRDVRREEEREGSFVDVYSFRLWCLLLWVALMNIGDSYFTLVHLQAGGIELNPLEQSRHPIGALRFVRADVEGLHPLRDGVADPHAWIQRRRRVLEDHLDATAIGMPLGRTECE